jgi:CRISPR/Cas system-associated exonuclease Cas4 (RecB family)
MTTKTKSKAVVPIIAKDAGMRAFDCEVTGEEVATADCLSCAANGAPGCPTTAAFIHAIINDPRPHDFSQRLAKAHGADFGISVTELLYCPRKFRLKMAHSWTEKPSDYYARVLGTAFHAILEKYEEQGIAEERMITTFDYRGVKVLFSGKPDLVTYSDAGWLITDYKRTGWPPRNSYSYTCPKCYEVILSGITDRRKLKFYCEDCDEAFRRSQVHQIVHPPEAKSSHAMQISLLALLLNKNEEQYASILEEKHGVIAADAPPAFSGKVVYLGPQKILPITVGVDLEAARALLCARIDVLLRPELPPKEPLEGWECKYCPVAAQCDAAA